MSLSPDGKRCLATDAEQLILRDTSDGKIVRKYEFTFDNDWLTIEDDITCLAVDWNREIAVTGDQGGVLRAWSLDLPECLWAIHTTSKVPVMYGLAAVALSDDGTIIYSAGFDPGKPASLKLWEFKTGKLLRTLARGNFKDVTKTPHYKDVFPLRGGKTALLSTFNAPMDEGGCYLALWDLETDRAVWRVRKDGSPLLLDATADGRRIVEVPRQARDHVLLVRDSNGREVRSVPVDKYGASALRLSADGSLAVTGGRGGPVIWDLDHGTVVAHDYYIDEKPSVGTISLSANSKLALTGGVDQRLQLWDLQTGEVRLDMSGPRPRRFK